MTTTVKILIEGNKACKVEIIGADGAAGAWRDPSPATVKPGEFTTKLIHGDQSVSVVEVGEFI